MFKPSSITLGLISSLRAVHEEIIHAQTEFGPITSYFGI